MKSRTTSSPNLAFSKSKPKNKTMSSPISKVFFLSFTIALLYVAYTIPRLQPKQTNLLFYMHENLTRHYKSATIVAERSVSASNILHFGTIVAIDDPITVGPSIESEEIGRAQGFYIHSAVDGTALHLVFSVVFTGGQYNGSALEIQGSDIRFMNEMEFGIASGTGYFRFVKGFGVMMIESTNIDTMRTVLKINVTVKHF